jgi:hypothetical protein
MLIEGIDDITGRTILVTNGEGEDDEEEWHLIDFGRDEDYFEAFSIYRRFIGGLGFAYAGGWANQISVHIEIIELFQALDALVERPKNGEQ